MQTRSGSRAKSLTLSTKLFPSRRPPALPPDGGVGSIRVEGFRHRDILSFGSAYAEVVGTEPEDGVYETLSLSVVEKFNLLDVVTCDRIVARLTSRFPGVAKDGCEPPQELSVVPIGSRFEGLRIGNHFFERLELAPDYFCEPERASWTGLLKAAEYDRDGGLSALTLPGANGNPVPLPTVEQKQPCWGSASPFATPNQGPNWAIRYVSKFRSLVPCIWESFFAAPPHAA